MSATLGVCHPSPILWRMCSPTSPCYYHSIFFSCSPDSSLLKLMLSNFPAPAWKWCSICQLTFDKQLTEAQRTEGFDSDSYQFLSDNMPCHKSVTRPIHVWQSAMLAYLACGAYWVLMDICLLDNLMMIRDSIPYTSAEKRQSPFLSHFHIRGHVGCHSKTDSTRRGSTWTRTNLYSALPFRELNYVLGGRVMLEIPVILM